MSLYRKYRPQKFADLVGEDHVRDTLLLAIRENRVGHGYLFAGPRGTGKTTVARLLAKAINCVERGVSAKSGSGEPCNNCQSCREITLGKSLDIIEIDAASNRGIDEIRELRDKVKFAPSGGKFKVFIIDEVHMLTMPAFNALLKTLEEPPKHAIFIMATTEAHKVPATILSRVQRFDFRRIGKNDIVKNLKSIASGEKLEVTDESLEAIAVVADGSHRDAVSLLQQVASLSKEITILEVRNILGLARSEEIIRLVSLIADGKRQEAIGVVSEFVEAGVEASQIIKEIIEVLRQLLLTKISTGEVIFDQTKERATELKELSKKFSADEINRVLSIFIEAGQLLKDSPIRTLPIEMGIIEAVELTQKSQPKSDQPVAEKVKIEEPKKEIESSKVEIVKSPVQPPPTNSQPLDEQSWKTILERIKEYNHTLNALLRDAKPEGIEGDKILLSVRFKFHHDKITEVKNREILEKVINEVLGGKYIIACQIKEKAKAPKHQSTGVHKEEDLEKAAKAIFETE